MKIKLEIWDIVSPFQELEIINVFNLYAPIIGNLHISLTNIGLITATLLITIIIVTNIGVSYMTPLPTIKRTNSFLRKYRSDFDNDKHNGKHVELGFWNIPRRLRAFPGEDLEERPSKIIFDKNDRTGALLPIIYPGTAYENHSFMYNGTLWNAITTRIFFQEYADLGTIERVNDNTYVITGPHIKETIIQDLRSKNINVTSGGLPLRTVVQNSTKPDSIRTSYNTYTFIYGNRREAIGDFNNEGVLPQN